MIFLISVRIKSWALTGFTYSLFDYFKSQYWYSFLVSVEREVLDKTISCG